METITFDFLCKVCYTHMLWFTGARWLHLHRNGSLYNFKEIVMAIKSTLIGFDTLVDLFNSGLDILRLRQGAREIAPGKKGEGATSSIESGSDKNLPTNLITEKLTRIDNSYWKLIKSLPPPEVRETIRKLEIRMRIKDTGNETTQYDLFRIDTLLMPNVTTEKVTEVPVPARQGQRQKGEGGTKTKTVTETISTQFDPEKDFRVVYLKGIHEDFLRLLQTNAPDGTRKLTENEALDVIIESLDLSEDSLRKKAQAMLSDSAKIVERSLEEARKVALDANFRLAKAYLGTGDPIEAKAVADERIKSLEAEKTKSMITPMQWWVMGLFAIFCLVMWLVPMIPNHFDITITEAGIGGVLLLAVVAILYLSLKKGVASWQQKTPTSSPKRPNVPSSPQPSKRRLLTLRRRGK